MVIVINFTHISVSVVLHYYIEFSDITVHALNSAYILVDHTFLSGLPVNLAHFYHTLIYVGIYSIFNVVYCVLGGTNPLKENYIYEQLDWENSPVQSSINIVLWLVFGIAIFHTFVFALYKLRKIIYLKYNRSRTERIHNDEMSTKF